MGTNFYVSGSPVSDDPKWHIGKRSSAGSYCWDCMVTLCKGGVSGIHRDCDWHEVCPVCGECAKEDTLKELSASSFREFGEEGRIKKIGVKVCSSFSWAMNPDFYKSIIKDNLTLRSRVDNLKIGEVNKVIVDQYGRKFTISEFEDLLKECPIQYTHNVDKWFC